MIREQTERLRALTEENRKLSEIIHRDNKLIPAMELSVRTYLQSDGQDHLLGAQLLEQLSTLTAERKGILTQYEQDGETIQHTGCAAIDIVLDYMHQRAKQESVRFQTNCLDFQLAMKKQKIEESDIKTILADLIENAIISCRESAHKQVFVYIGTIRNRFIIRVFDSGIPFELETLRKIGIETTTTHAETGGSGIGMQSLFALKRKYASSILIQEHNQEQGLFTKDISVIFNRFNQFIIRSYRSDQIRSKCSRSDMIVEAEDTAREQATLNVLSTQS
jgi:C4-dicarboxylate-specific signal transduction histidine kinase